MSKIPEFQRAIYFGIVRVLRECATIIESNPKECVPFNVNKFVVRMALLKEKGVMSGMQNATVSFNDNNGEITVENFKAFNASEITSYAVEYTSINVEGCEDCMKVRITTNDFTVWLHIKKN